MRLTRSVAFQSRLFDKLQISSIDLKIQKCILIYEVYKLNDFLFTQTLSIFN